MGAVEKIRGSLGIGDVTMHDFSVFISFSHNDPMELC